MPQDLPQENDNEETRQNIPISVALTLLALVISAVVWSMDLRDEISDKEKEFNLRVGDLEAKMLLEHSDRFKGMDMDIFIERLQREFDKRAYDSTYLIQTPSWRLTY